MASGVAYKPDAYHADRAGLTEKAKKFYILAGEEAAHAYQNSLAIESYTHALRLSAIENIQERIDLLLGRAALYRIIGDSTGQEQDLATLELLAERQKNKRNLAVVILRQADFAFDKGKLQEAQSLAQRSIEIAESVQALDVAAHAYRILPLTLARQGQIKEAIRLAQIGLQLTQQVKDRESEGQIFNELGLITLEQRETDQSRDYFEKSLLIARETSNRRLEAQVLNNMGLIFGMYENDYTTARKYFEKILAIVQEIGNRNGEGYALENLGWATSMRGDFEMALHYLMEALTISRETGNHSQEGNILVNLSAMMVTQGNYSEALVHTIQALKISRDIGERSIEAWSLLYLGHANLGSGNYQEALNAYQKAFDIRQLLEQYSLSMETLAGLAQVELQSGNLANALSHAEKILKHLTDGGNLEGTEEPLRIYHSVYQVLTENGDPRADKVLENAYSILKEQASKIHEQAYKDIFIQNVPWRREIEKIWMKNQAEKKQDS